MDERNALPRVLHHERGRATYTGADQNLWFVEMPDGTIVCCSHISFAVDTCMPECMALPPRGSNVLRAPGGMRLATDAELLAINRLGLRWEDLASLEACISVAKVEVAKHRAIAANPAYAMERRREYMRRYTARARKGKR